MWVLGLVIMNDQVDQNLVRGVQTELQRDLHLSDAQIGLVVATPIIIGFSIALYRMGVLQRYSTAVAVTASCVIAAVLFFQQ